MKLRAAAAAVIVVAAPAVGAREAAATSTAVAWSGPCHAAVDAIWQRDRSWAHAVVQRESRGLPQVRNPRALGRGGRLGRASGCFQLVPGYAGPYLRRAGCAAVLDARCNVAAAWELYKTAGRRPWRT